MKRFLLLPLLLALVACEDRADSTNSLAPLPSGATRETILPTTTVPTAQAGPVTETTTEVQLDAKVPWENYEPGLREHIFGLAMAGDCEGLQAEFATAYESNDEQFQRVGVGNTDLLTYLDELLEIVGCY